MDMRIRRLAVFVPVIIGMLCCTSCIKRNLASSLAKEAPEEILTENISMRDSIAKGENSMIVQIDAEFPTDGNLLAINSIQEWMSETMGGTYNESLKDGKKMVKYYYTKARNELKEDLEQEDCSFLLVQHFTKGYETDKFVTYNFTQESYAGGAHGSYYSTGETFRKLDGRRLGHEIFRHDRLDSLRKLITNALIKQFFGTAEDLAAAAVDGPTSIFLPNSAPLFEKDGIRFTYQEYEFTFYAAGSPTCVISYAEIEPFLTVTAKSLIPNTQLATK